MGYLHRAKWILHVRQCIVIHCMFALQTSHANIVLLNKCSFLNQIVFCTCLSGDLKSLVFVGAVEKSLKSLRCGDWMRRRNWAPSSMKCWCWKSAKSFCWLKGLFAFNCLTFDELNRRLLAQMVTSEIIIDGKLPKLNACRLYDKNRLWNYFLVRHTPFFSQLLRLKLFKNI